MSVSKYPSQLEIGNRLTQLRENARLKQADLARKVTWSQAVLSRVESGERSLEDAELDSLLIAIGTPEAIELKKNISRDWQIIQRPALDHQDQDLIWSAEETAQKLIALAKQDDVRHALERRLTAYIEELKSGSELLLKREHQIAFVGRIGIGKSTAICRLTGLEVIHDDANLTPVLETGAGGITICEVHLRSGPQYGLIVEPRNEEEIRADVNDFADYLIDEIPGVTNDVSEEDSQGISREVERAIRNLANLRVRREKNENGKTNRRDEAKELAAKFKNKRELVVEILALMEFHRRDRRDIWYEVSTGKEPMDWLKEVFEKINNGRHPEFSLPKRIEIVIPRNPLEVNDLLIRLIDTKGIDRTSARSDLEGLLDDPHTTVLLCSGFNDAPAVETRTLLERAIEAGTRNLNQKTALLVLPRPNEALAVKDELGQRVETAIEGYELKAEQISMNLKSNKLDDLSVSFFNSQEDSPDLLRSFLTERITHVRKAFRKHLFEIIQNANAMLLNYEKEQAQVIVEQASSQLKTIISEIRIPTQLDAHIQDSLIEQMKRSYAATVRASVNRQGEWHNLNYGYQLGYGARRLAALSLGKSVEYFSVNCKNIEHTDGMKEAQELVAQSSRLLQNSYEELLVKVQLMGQTSFKNELKLDNEFWVTCQNEWGQGDGYKERVTSHCKKWFDQGQHLHLEEMLLDLIRRQWDSALQRIELLLTNVDRKN